MNRLAVLETLLGQPAPVLEAGHVWLVGAGPGDPGQLTLDAVAALAQAETLVHDELVDPRILALAPEGAERLYMGKRGGRPSARQADITAALIEQARAGRRVVRLKGGDPYVFGRGGEEALALAEAGIPFRVVPGLTAGLAGLAAAGIPATQRGVNQAVVLATGHAAEGADEALDWAALARLGQPLVLYMAMRRLEAIAVALLAGGLAAETPVAVVAEATTPRERVLVSTLADVTGAVRRAGMAAPAVVAIGGVVSLRGRLRPG
ncbi:uroporphyrinogen-III C-methyltransferase [Roseomonas sp. M0104]|uniref:uroporphyrinogen-III C-methyltransferase n=1 Tax=Teichococcus coralli TaxID=2545983 RepID=A0A845BDL9_9PROT|nr:uroporphyrinogen-III C-methyltransferase [Pseudoroseomonas coralli]MXP64144.1 uroporphyrinogen-III C-methyltransferase [Pseudoroseomonas coralli]